jgi:hypothetical protein
MMSGTTVGDSAAMTDPVTSKARRTSATRRFPNMSPSLPEMGTHIADTSRVTVITQAVSSRAAPRSSGSFAWIGIRIVCMKDAPIPAKARTAMTAPARGSVGMDCVRMGAVMLM